MSDQEFKDQITRIEAQMKAMNGRLVALGAAVQEVAGLLDSLLEIGQEAAEFEVGAAVPQSNQAEVLAEAIKLIADKDEEPKKEFPGWGAPLKKGK